jgi:hypothetical protein
LTQAVGQDSVTPNNVNITLLCYKQLPGARRAFAFFAVLLWSYGPTPVTSNFCYIFCYQLREIFVHDRPAENDRRVMTANVVRRCSVCNLAARRRAHAHPSFCFRHFREIGSNRQYQRTSRVSFNPSIHQTDSLLDETFQRVDLVHRRLADISAGVAAGRHRRPPATRSRCSNCRPARRVKACSPFIPFLAPICRASEKIILKQR